MISHWPPGSESRRIEEGFVLFHVSELEQHAGIAAKAGDLDGPVEVYAVAREGVRETWNLGPDGKEARWKVRVVGWVDHPDFELQHVQERVMICCRDLERRAMGKRKRGHACCWRLRPPYRLVSDEETGNVIFSGSCSGFVEHCYEQAGVDLVREDGLPETKLRSGERGPVVKEYSLAPGGTIRRLFPSYQIRAFQKDTYPWDPDTVFQWFPENFDR
ncbi:hypothetical protein [Pyxidicoccus sp. MSG2]|uniref:hypothetical protein n=1 Tax=Pyxidicoccus sp. MSG2 TaxID=2996790 RepID=UPI00226E0A43|nr:hypothetical protein [Pyxidicoccus sp. MSG2]MCY1021358.1 hypothetical protein [Pyxidicoccus sp. MSG2]